MRKAIAGEEVHIGERLRDELLGFIVGHLFHESGDRGTAGGKRVRFHEAGANIVADFRRIGLHDFGLERFEGFRRSRIGREQAHLAKNTVELVLGGFGLRLSIDELLENFFRTRIILRSEKSVTELRERIGEPERITGATVGVHEPFARFKAAGHVGSKASEKLRDDVVLATINHGNAQFGDEGHCAIGLTSFEFGFGDFLGKREILFVGLQNAKSEPGGIFPIVGLQVQIEKELSVLAAFFEAGQIFQDIGRASVIALCRIGTGFNRDGGNARGIELERLIGQLFTFGMIGTGQSTLRRGNVGFDRVRVLTHRLVQIG